jgi:hypothetical protein
MRVGAVLVLLSGCHDSPTGPLSGVTTVETVPSLGLVGPLPELTDLVPADASGGVKDAAAAWAASWDEPDGEEARARARETVAAHLAGVMDERAVEEALRPLLWMETEVGDLEGLPAALVVPLERARRLTMESGEARRSGDLEIALEKGLAAADHYRSVTPEAVARSMVVRAERRIAEQSGLEVEAPEALDSTSAQARDENVPEQSHEAVLQRAEHLVGGARRALDNGDFTQAIQRAFYAVQVLDGRMVDPEL